MIIRLAHEMTIDSIVDGEGIRATIWTQGCSHNCLGCHNPETHSFKDGFLYEVDALKKDIKKLSNHDGITLSGGDPFFQMEASLEIALYCHSIGLNVWCYTGYTFEQLLDMSISNSKIIDFLNEIDILVDSKFVLELRSLDLLFKGSSNQRILDVKKSLKEKKAIVCDKYNKDEVKQTKKDLIFI